MWGEGVPRPVHPHILYPYYRGNKKEVLEASSLKVFEDKKQAITSLHQSTEKKVKKLKSPQFNPNTDSCIDN